ncbi:RluA family pseudouridine synthase [Trichothermofontia sp.]
MRRSRPSPKPLAQSGRGAFESGFWYAGDTPLGEAELPSHRYRLLARVSSSLSIPPVLSPQLLDTSVQTFVLQVDQAGQRLDRWLAESLVPQYPELSRSRIQKLIEQGQVQRNGEVCTRKQEPVQKGDCLVVTLPPAVPTDLQPEAMPLEILYEDEQVLVLNKPAGLVVHPAPGHATGTLVHGLLAYCDRLPEIGGAQRPGIVHRLDKDTSGALMIAKTDLAYHHLQRQLQNKTASRLYVAVVQGTPAQEEGTIDLPIGRHPVDRKRMAALPGDPRARAAVTHWQVLERLENYTLMQFRLETGRTHQIRVHSSAISHPIVGDPVYGSGRSLRSLGVNLTGQALHAWKLCFQHPVTGEPLAVTAPWPPSLETLLTVLRRRCP